MSKNLGRSGEGVRRRKETVTSFPPHPRFLPSSHPLPKFLLTSDARPLFAGLFDLRLEKGKETAATQARFQYPLLGKKIEMI